MTGGPGPETGRLLMTTPVPLHRRRGRAPRASGLPCGVATPGTTRTARGAHPALRGWSARQDGATIAAIEDHLTDPRGLVYRDQHVTEDGLAGLEGAFLLCAFWRAYCHAFAGGVDRARGAFERAIASRNDLGPLSEEVGPGTGELLGNMPQAFSHVGLVNAAWTIHEAESQL